jgi:hypothetical protein
MILLIKVSLLHRLCIPQGLGCVCAQAPTLLGTLMLLYSYLLKQWINNTKVIPLAELLHGKGEGLMGEKE